MSNVIMFITFKLVEGASVPDFLLASEKLNDGHMSKQKGYISWKQLVEGEMWADLVTWETMEDAQKMMDPNMDPSSISDLEKEFCSFIDQESVKMHLFSVAKSY